MAKNRIFKNKKDDSLEDNLNQEKKEKDEKEIQKEKEWYKRMERVKQTQEYKDGWLAWDENESEEDNPYPISDNRRYSWFMGFYDNRWKDFH